MSMSSRGERLAELYERWGRRVFEADGVYFTNVDPGSRMFTPVVDHGDYSFNREQSAGILRRGKGLMLRYPTTRQPGLLGGAYVCEDAGYGLSHLNKRMRNYVRRGLEQCEIRELDRAELLAQGLRLNVDTDQRHGRLRPEFCEEARWKSTVSAAYATPGVFVLGALTGGALASYQIGILDGEWAYALIQMSREDMLAVHPNHALDFTFNQWAFRQGGVRGISIGPVPLRMNEGLHNYKLRMGFKVCGRQTALRLHPLLARLGTSAAIESLLARARQWRPLTARLEGVEIAIRGSRITAQEEVAAAGTRAVAFSPVAGEK